jgi:hypothetical protein
MISPAKSQATLWASANAAELTAVTAMPATSSGLRPIRSETGPKSSNVGISTAT